MPTQTGRKYEGQNVWYELLGMEEERGADMGEDRCSALPDFPLIQKFWKSGFLRKISPFKIVPTKGRLGCSGR